MITTLKSVSLTGSMNYQIGSIVSKQILRSNNGSVTLVAFDRNEIMNEHASPYETMLQVIEGTIDIIVGGTSNLIKAGEYVQLPAEFSHALQAKEKTKILLIMMK